MYINNSTLKEPQTPQTHIIIQNPNTTNSFQFSLMASIIPREFLSSTNQNNNNNNNTLLFPSYSELSGLVPVPPEEDLNIAPYYRNDFGSVDGFSSEKLGLCDGVVSANSAEYRSNNININNNNNNNISSINGGISGDQNFGGLGFININNAPVDNGFDQFGEEYHCCMTSSFLPELKPFSQNNWGMQININQVNNVIEESNIMKVSRYSEEERKERIVRYLKKRNQRNFNKTIKYACRKTLADRRVRVRGRFARNNNELLCDHLHDQQMEAEKIIVDHDPTRKDIQVYCDDGLQMIKFDDDEEWLQNFALCC